MGAKLQAPKGGCYSEENREWYEGGQFLPSTCLPKGVAKRVGKAANIAKNIAELIIRTHVVSVRYAGEAMSAVLFSGKDAAEARAFADALVEAKSASAVAAGFVPHPTSILSLLNRTRG